MTRQVTTATAVKVRTPAVSILDRRAECKFRHVRQSPRPLYYVAETTDPVAVMIAKIAVVVIVIAVVLMVAWWYAKSTISNNTTNFTRNDNASWLQSCMSRNPEFQAPHKQVESEG